MTSRQGTDTAKLGLTAKQRVLKEYPKAACVQSESGSWFVYRSNSPMDKALFTQPIGRAESAAAAWKAAAGNILRRYA